MPTRAEHRRETLLALSDAAVELFGEFGVSITFDDIAVHVGLSPRTVFRYVSMKEELAFLHQRLWLEQFDVAVATLSDGGDLPLAKRLWVGASAVAEFVDADPERPRRALQVAGELPELGRGHTLVFNQWLQRLGQECLSDPADKDDRFRARVVASATMGVLDATALEWAANSRRPLFRTVLRSGFEHLRPMLDGVGD